MVVALKGMAGRKDYAAPTGLEPEFRSGTGVAATPRRRKVQATPSSPVTAAIIPLPKKCDGGVAVILWRRGVAATCNRATSEFGLNLVWVEVLQICRACGAGDDRRVQWDTPAQGR